jgi:hypothetical protein
MVIHSPLKGPLRAAALVLGLLAFAPGIASATVVFDLTSGNPAISGYAGPYGQVSVNLVNSTEATITLTSDYANGNIYLFGGAGTIGLNVNATSFQLKSVTATQPNSTFSPWTLTGSGSGNEDGFGSFNLSITGFDGFTHSTNSITVTVDNTSGTWASPSDVLKPNANNALVAAHVFVTTSPANAANGALATGYAANAGAINTPAPSTMVLALSGLVVVGFVGVRRLRRPQAASV